MPGALICPLQASVRRTHVITAVVVLDSMSISALVAREWLTPKAKKRFN